MSELKVHRFITTDELFPEANAGALYYDKSEADKVIVRNKYKRCSAMARWCERKRVDAANYRIPRETWEFYDKWHKRWLAIAVKFKEAK